MSNKRLIIAGASSGVGKTTITCAIINELRNKGFTVSPFKVGPDYIDPLYLGVAAGRPAHNLDTWIMGSKNRLLESFLTHSKNSDISVIEGVMGYYDGHDGKTDLASTFQVSSITRSPVILVVDASKAARSVAAVALGFKAFKKNSRIIGVILNRLASYKHQNICWDAFSDLNIPILGTIHRDESLKLKERHLGLDSTIDHTILQERIQDIAKSIKLDTSRILDLLSSCVRPLPPPLSHMASSNQTSTIRKKINRTIPQHLGLSSLKPRTIPHKAKNSNKPVIAVALDNSFNFYYQDNLDALYREGAELIFFSPVSDKKLPACDGVYIGGGFPEILSEQLERNESMMKSIKRAAEDEAPIYAECGGLMYLCKDITTQKGTKHKMVGLFDPSVVMTKRPVLGYTKGMIDSYTPITGGKKHAFRGHEFHYSKMIHVPRDAKLCMILDNADDEYRASYFHNSDEEVKSRNMGIWRYRDGIMMYNTLAAYGHLYFDMSAFAYMFVENSKTYKRR